MSIGKCWKIAIILLLAAVTIASAPFAFRWWRRRSRDAQAAQCRAARDGQKWDELARLAGEWAARDSQIAAPRMFLAEAAEARRDWPAVAEHLARIPETDPKAVPALIELAKLEFGPLNRPLAGEEVCQKILRLQPLATFAHQRLIQYYAISLQREKLVRQIRFAIDREREPPEAYVYLLLLDSLRMGNGFETNQHWLEANPDQEVLAVASAMQIPELQDDLAGVPAEQREAVRAASAEKSKLVEGLLQKYPGNLELLSYQLERFSMLGDAERVADLLSRVPEAGERDSRFWRFKGWLHETYDELPEAEIAFTKALEIHPLDWNAWNRLAVVNRRLKNVVEVARSTNLVEQAMSLRKRIRALPAAEEVTAEILADLSKYARACGALWVADPLDRRLRQQQIEFSEPLIAH